MTVRSYVFDVDDVFVDMDGLAARAVDAVAAPLSERLGESLGSAVQRRFAVHYDILRRQLRSAPHEQTPDFLRLRTRIEHWQRGVLDAGHELKIWSRETMLVTALEAEGAPVSRSLVEAVVGRYWATLREHSRVFEDAASAVDRIRARGEHVHLATNSDGNLVFDGETFRYDPEHARATKWSRLRVLESIGFTSRDVTIGDPIGKPKPAFFSCVVDSFRRKVGPIEISSMLAVGDSYQDDIRPMLDLGVPQGVWLLRKSSGPRRFDDDPRVTIVNTLAGFEDALCVG